MTTGMANCSQNILGNYLSMAGVTLTRTDGVWTVDGERQEDVRQAVETFMARCYPHQQELPREFIQYQRRMSGIMLVCPSVMVRHARERGKMSVKELALKSGVSRRTIQRIEAGKSDPKASTLFYILHATGGTP